MSRTAIFFLRNHFILLVLFWALEAVPNSFSGEGWSQFSTPAPGVNAPGDQITAAEPSVNVSRGMFDAPFELHLSTETAGGRIRYTLDGSEPDAVRGLWYAGPLRIERTTTLRAATFLENALPSRVITHTYLFPQQVLSQPANPPGFPGTWGRDSNFPNSLAPADYEMDPEVVNHPAYRDRMLEGLLSAPALSLVLEMEDMFGASGIYSNTSRRTPAPLSQVEKPVSAELIYPDGRRGFQVDCGIRIQGGASRQPRNSPKHSLRLLFKRDYGPGRLEFPLFPGTPAREFNTLILRADYNNSWIHWDTQQRLRGSYVRDQWLRSTQAAMSGLGSHGMHVHLYINGLYWGLYNPSERGDAAFAATYLGGEREDYDAYTHRGVRDGDGAAWSTLFNLARRDLSNRANYEALGQYLDVPHFIDYMIVNIYGGNQDWPHNNWNAVRRREPGAGWKFIAWDAERILEGVSVNRANLDGSNNPGELYLRLRSNPEFRMLFADRLHRHFFAEGELSPEKAGARYRAMAEAIELAVLGESARWGDYRRDVHTRNPPAYLFTYMDHWIPERDRLLANYFPQRSAVVLNQFRGLGLYPQTVAPIFERAGDQIVMRSPAGTIYYTLDGTDPRVYGTGGIAPGARVYTGPIAFSSSVQVKARTRAGGEWSALHETIFRAGENAWPVVISEIMYRPPDGEAFEFIELHHFGTAPVDLSGWHLDGVRFLFPVGRVLEPGAVVVLASDKNPAGFAARHPGVLVAGYFSGNLSNNGERVALLDRSGRTVDAVWYENGNGWPEAANGRGASLERHLIEGESSAPANWRANTAGGSPGRVAFGGLPPQVRLSEVMAWNVSAVEHGGNFPDWIELHNAGASAADLSGWSLSDREEPRFFVFPPGTTVPPNDYLMVWADREWNAPGLHTGFALNRERENLRLYDAQTNLVDGVSFGWQLPDFTLGRAPDGNWVLCNPTPGQPNTPAAMAGPEQLAINEWLLEPGPRLEGWIELHNRHATLPVALHNLGLGSGGAVWPLRPFSFIGPNDYGVLRTGGGPGPDRVDLAPEAGGGELVLLGVDGAELDRVVYGAQRAGISEGRLPDGTGEVTVFERTRSPGSANYLAPASGPRLNELLAINRTGAVNAFGRRAGWIELHQAGETPWELEGMSLSIGTRRPGEWNFPAGAAIVPGEHLVIWCDAGSPEEGGAALNLGKDLPPESGEVHLFNAAGQWIDGVEYGFQTPDRSIGRSGAGWALLEEPTPGAANAGAALLGSPENLRINEWMAWLPGAEDWIELFNESELPVNLSGLYLSDDPSLAGRWRQELRPLSFAGPRGFVLLIADGRPDRGGNHLDFALSRQGEMIGIYDPDQGWIDAIFFGAQQAGVSEGRLPDGSDAIVRFPHGPTPGQSNEGMSADRDGDGMPDWWESAHGFDPDFAGDAHLDADGDGMTNLEEYLAGTDPRDPESALFLEVVRSGPGEIRFRFMALAGQNYWIEFRETLEEGDWAIRQEIESVPVNQTMEMAASLEGEGSAGFFRLRTSRIVP